MSQLERFLDPSRPSLKVCGVTLASDAAELIRLGVDALGANFWPHSKRFLSPGRASWLEAMDGQILRVGVFVNQPAEEALVLWRKGWIDVIQLHGDEGDAHFDAIREAGAPFFCAMPMTPSGELTKPIPQGVAAMLLDAHAPGVFGGTGKTIDWDAALTVRNTHPTIPMILAGGITPDNAAAAIAATHAVALDVASGAESAPGIKDLDKVTRLLAAISPV